MTQPTSRRPRLVVTDLDGTLFHERGVVSDRAVTAIRACIDAGILVAIGTARPYLSVLHLLDRRLHSDLYWICSNGATIYRDQQLVDEISMTAETATSVLERLYAAPLDYVISMEAGGRLYIDQFVDHGTVPYVVAALLEIARNPVTKILVSSESIDGPVPLPDLPPEVASVTAGGGVYNSILSPEATKEAAIARLLPALGLGWADVIAFGDDLNDLGMLAASGIGVAMANSVPEALAVADRTTLANTEDGVAVVLEELLA